MIFLNKQELFDVLENVQDDMKETRQALVTVQRQYESFGKLEQAFGELEQKVNALTDYLGVEFTEVRHHIHVREKES